jgi:hypothetical protein
MKTLYCGARPCSSGPASQNLWLASHRAGTGSIQLVAIDENSFLAVWRTLKLALNGTEAQGQSERPGDLCGMELEALSYYCALESILPQSKMSEHPGAENSLWSRALPAVVCGVIRDCALPGNFVRSSRSLAMAAGSCGPPIIELPILWEVEASWPDTELK